MVGTKRLATAAIRLIPPMITSPTREAIAAPDAQSGMLYVVNVCAIVFA